MSTMKSPSYTSVREDEDYVYLLNDSGQPFALNKRTGELEDAVRELLPVGTLARTPEQQRQHAQWKAAQEAKQNSRAGRLQRRQTQNPLGNFFFAQSEDACNDVSPQTLTRLVYLATFLRHGTNQLYKTEQTPMRKSDLCETMQLSQKLFYIFWKEANGKYVFEDDAKNIFMSEHFFRGNLTNHLKAPGGFKKYQQIYIEAIRKLYRETPVTRHGNLGYIFQILPYINWQYNILCWNPKESELDNIDLMNLDELCSLVGYNQSQKFRLMKVYDTLRFEWRGKLQRFCSFVSGNFRTGTVRIFVNPHILHIGNNWQKVEVLGLFFRDD